MTWDLLLFLSGYALGSFLTGVCLYIVHKEHCADLRNFHANQLKTREDRAYSRGYADRSFLSRQNTPRL